MTRLIIDAHVHPQRFTPGFLKEGERFTYDKLENAIMSELPKGNSLMIAGMDRLGIIMSNEMLRPCGGTLRDERVGGCRSRAKA